MREVRGNNRFLIVFFSWETHHHLHYDLAAFHHHTKCLKQLLARKEVYLVHSSASSKSKQSSTSSVMRAASWLCHLIAWHQWLHDNYKRPALYSLSLFLLYKSSLSLELLKFVKGLGEVRSPWSSLRHSFSEAKPFLYESWVGRQLNHRQTVAVDNTIY